MKIAFISYEYPPDTACGGIATYTEQAARMLQARGHQVDVFTGGPRRNETIPAEGLRIHRIQVTDRSDFPAAIAPVFAEWHRKVGFDVLEGPDYGAEAAIALAQVPDIPLVLKLHTPTYLSHWANNLLQTWPAQARMTLGAWRRGKLPQRRAPYNPLNDPEYHHAHQADEISAPSSAIGDRVGGDWQLPSDRLSVVPLPFCPSPDLLNIPLDTATHTITFIGRLEVRKGILDLAHAIPTVLRQRPDTRFRFIGAALSSPKPGLNMQDYLTQQFHRYRCALEFVGSVSPQQIPAYLAQTDICVFPSIWESFGLVCLEAMAAGRGVVASRAGGMADLLDGGRLGRLVSPRQPRSLAIALLDLLNHPTQRMHCGAAARQQVLATYNFERIAALQVEGYRRAIAHRQRQGPRRIPFSSLSLVS